MHEHPLYDVISADTEFTATLSSNAEVKELPDATLDLLNTFFPNIDPARERLPFSLHCWLIDQVRQNDSLQLLQPFKAITTFSRHGRILIVILIKPPKEPDFLLFLQEDPTAFQEYQHIRSQLTRRQLEIYHLIKDGERDIRTIARHMGISVRTAEGHKMNLQRILPQL